MKRLLFPILTASVVMAAGASALAADPTLDQVYEAVHAGQLDQAQRMMAEVLRDHPNSARAHYVEASARSSLWRVSAGRTVSEPLGTLDHRDSCD
jgi:hypothetical protein